MTCNDTLCRADARKESGGEKTSEKTSDPTIFWMNSERKERSVALWCLYAIFKELKQAGHFLAKTAKGGMCSTFSILRKVAETLAMYLST